MCHLPLDIVDAEKIVRVIISPYHVHRRTGALTTRAFQSKAGIDEVSVIRHSHMGSDFCKAKGQAIAAANSDASYKGLAVIPVGIVRDCGSTVLDSREEFCGHAHIAHGYVKQPNEPLSAEENFALTRRLQYLLAHCTYYEDPAPASTSWTGSTI